MEKTKQVAVTPQATPDRLIELAITNNADIDKLERLMELQERWQAGQAQKAYLQAKAEFQGKVPDLQKKSKVNYKTSKGNINYSFIPLGQISKQIAPAMFEAGLSYSWQIDDSTEKIKVTCIISHVDGHSEQTSMSAAKDATGAKNEIQQRASTVTYLQRYTLIAALGLTTADQDTDADHQPDTREQMHPQHPKWTGAAKALSEQTATIPQIAKKYILTETNKTKLIDEAAKL